MRRRTRKVNFFLTGTERNSGTYLAKHEIETLVDRDFEAFLEHGKKLDVLCIPLACSHVWAGATRLLHQDPF
jgi:hypothetical protein